MIHIYFKSSCFSLGFSWILLDPPCNDKKEEYSHILFSCYNFQSSFMKIKQAVFFSSFWSQNIMKSILFGQVCYGKQKETKSSATITAISGILLGPAYYTSFTGHIPIWQRTSTDAHTHTHTHEGKNGRFSCVTISQCGYTRKQNSIPQWHPWCSAKSAGSCSSQLITDLLNLMLF